MKLQLVHPRNSILNCIDLIVASTYSCDAIKGGNSMNHAGVQRSSFHSISFWDTFRYVVGRPQVRRHLWHYLGIHEPLCWLVLHAIFFKLLLELSV